MYADFQKNLIVVQDSDVAVADHIHNFICVIYRYLACGRERISFMNSS